MALKRRRKCNYMIKKVIVEYLSCNTIEKSCFYLFIPTSEIKEKYRVHDLSNEAKSVLQEDQCKKSELCGGR